MREPSTAQVKQVKLKKAQLDKMPVDERTLLAMLGCYGNEISTFIRLASWSLSCPENCPYIEGEAQYIEYEARTSQVFLLSRLLIGKLVEFDNALRKFYFGSKVSKKYDCVISQIGRNSLAEFRERIKSKILVNLRNKIIFHSDYGMYGSGFDKLASHAELSIYTQRRSQQYFQYADAGLHYILAEITGKPPLPSLTFLVNESRELAGLAMRFIEECFAKILEQNLTQRELACETVTLGEAQPFDAIAIPCFTAPALRTDPPLMPLTVRLPSPQPT